MFFTGGLEGLGPSDCVKSPAKPSAIGYTQVKGENGYGILSGESREQIIMLPDCIDDYNGP
jgi:hypothetical protein